MTRLLELQPSLRHALADGLTQARSAVRRSGTHFLAPSFPGMTGADDCRLLNGPPLEKNDGDEEAENVAMAWPQQGLISTRWPVVIFALDGECDMRFGISSVVRRRVPMIPSAIEQYVATVRGGQFLLFPSYFPHSDGSSMHWERPDLENAACTLMWFIFLPTGCLVHFCETRGPEHTQSKSIYLAAQRTFRLMEEFETEVLAHHAQWKTAARHYLEIVLLLLQRNLGSLQVEVGGGGSNFSALSCNEPAPSPSHTVLQHACHFIEDRLQEPLRIPQIAAAVGVSLPSLNRLFREYMQTTVAQYIISRRLERASTLLRETNFAVSQVAMQSGFPRQEHFSRSFRRSVGISPLAYRQRHQKRE